MQSSAFTLYSASAGSGKTYALTKAYLKRLLSSSAATPFRQFLALTFTNKAVEEMKTRVLGSLHNFSQEVTPPKHQSLFRALCNELHWTPAQLQQRSQELLKRILHNYAFFEISTIDKFNHKVAKTFARDLQLSQNFEVQLDTNLLLEEAVGRLLERAGNKEMLTRVLLDFSLEKVEDDKSWDIAYDLMNIGQLLFQENHAAAIALLQSKTIADFHKIQQQITTKIRALENQAVTTAQAVLHEIAAQGFVPTDFPRQTLPNHFKKIVEGEFTPRKLYSNTLEQQLRTGKLLKASDTRKPTPLALWILDHFLALKHCLYQRSFLKNRYGNIVPLTLLNEIARTVQEIEQDKNLIPITTLNALLAQEIKDQPAPFIYERMGEKYRHYFIDEFQDTSQLQWHNLIPLISHALESEDENQKRGSLFLVGDVKQAIYRWRGGKAEQFLHLLQGQSQPFAVVPSIHSLETNWRSYDQIIDFNNSFFTTIAPALKNEAYQTLFLQGNQQKANPKSGGFVQLSFLDKDTELLDEVHGQEVLNIIRQLTAQHYPYSDLCILVRDNKKGRYLADFLAQHHIPIVSSEALLLQNNATVDFLIALLQYMADNKNQEAAYRLLLFLAQTVKDKHAFIARNLDTVASFLSQNYGFSIVLLRRQAVLYIVEHAIIRFDLDEKAPAYLMALMDEILEIEKKNGASIHAFLNHWEQKKHTLSITAPEHLNAVKITTIHKSKGLEFPFVIFPFANALLDDKRKRKKLWVPTPADEQDLGIDAWLLNATRDMEEYSPEAAQVYQKEEEKTVLDALNVLYVALTRAVKGLFIITENGKAINTINKATSYSDLFRYYLQKQELFTEDKKVYTRGALTRNTENTRTTANFSQVPYITRSKAASNFTPAARSGDLWDDARRRAIDIGNLTHWALGKIKTTADVSQVLESLEMVGSLSQETLDRLKHLLHAVIYHPELKSYFSNNYEVWNEREILTPRGVTLRPDRILHNHNQLILIEYKTGLPHPSHQSQVARYTEALEAMGFVVKRAIIVYMNNDVDLVYI